MRRNHFDEVVTARSRPGSTDEQPSSLLHGFLLAREISILTE
jgi:hypothetical protein